MKWIHLSDIHYNSRMDGRSTNELRSALLEYLEDEQITADYMFLTGDYRHAGYQKWKKEDVAKAAAEFILDIAQAAEISPANIYIIPGNHDLDRTLDWRRMKRIRKEYDFYDGRFAEGNLDFLWDRFSFFQYVNQELVEHGMKDIWSASPGLLHPYCCLEDINLLFLNTCLLCNADKDRGHLLVGNNDIYQSLEEIKRKNSDKPIIVLAHHGLEYFEKREKEEVEKLLGKYPVLFYLCGDAHEIWAERINSFLEFTMGCLVQGQNIQATFSVGELKEGNKYSIEAHKWDAHTSEWGEYTQFNRKFRMWTPRFTQKKLALSEVVTKTRPVSASSHFVGGNLNVGKIEDALRYKARIVLLHGIGGIGKTELCRFLFEKYTMKTGSAMIKKVGWITYRNTLKDSFFGQFPEIISSDVEYYWQEVKRYINELGYELLLVIDNADEMTDQEFLMLEELGCRMILTARKSVDRITTIEIEPLPMAECRKLYRAYSRDDSTDDSLIEDIVTLTAGHTLAIELLAKVQYYASITTENLYKELQQKDFDLSDIMEKIPYVHSPEKNSDEVWDKRFMEHMEKLFNLAKIRNNPEEMRVMQLFSLLAAGVPVPVRTAEEWMGLADLNTLNDLSGKSWLIRDNQSKALSFMIHPLIASVVRYSCMPTEEAAGALIRKAADDIFIKVSETHMDKLDILPHAEAVAKHISLCTEDYIWLLACIAGVYLNKAEYARALQYFENVLALQKERSGEVHLDIAKVYHSIAMVYDGQGNYNAALAWLEKGLEINRKLFGEKGINTAMSYSNMISIYLNLGKYQKAREMSVKSLEMLEAISEEVLLQQNALNEEFLGNKAAIYINTGAMYYRFGELKQARMFYEKAWEIQGTLSGTDHPTTATIYGNIAAICRTERKSREALERYEVVKEIYEKRMGLEHPNVAYIYKNIGNVHKDMKMYNEALHWYEKALTIQLKVLGKNHPHVANTYNDIGVVYHAQRDYEQAFQYFESALEIANNMPEGEYSSMKQLLLNIGDTYRDLGKIWKARECYMAAEKI